MPAGRRSDGRLHDTGLIRPYRPCPSDFRDRFVELGWQAIGDHYRTNWRVIRRWIAEAGGGELREARAERVREHGRRLLHLTPVDAAHDHRVTAVTEYR